MSLIIWCLLVGGCARPHLYPICFYQQAPGLGRFRQDYAPPLTTAFRTIVKNKEAIPTITPDGRWLIANTTKSQNSRIAKVWPRLGCIGNASDSLSTKQEADCVAYVSEFIKTKNYFAFGNARDLGGFDIWNESPIPGTLVHCDQVKPDGK